MHFLSALKFHSILALVKICCLKVSEQQAFSSVDTDLNIPASVLIQWQDMASILNNAVICLRTHNL